jgi:hypothetical protein
MRRLVGAAAVWTMVVMLAVTTPVGTDDAEHRDLLLHPIFPHLHIENGHLVIHAAHASRAAQTLPARKPGPALGAATGADGVSLGLALTPPVPGLEARWSAPGAAMRLRDEDQPLPTGRAEAPPDPPPTHTTS